MSVRETPSTQALAMLSFAAGFADASTFLHLSGLFAAHVTGNIVLLAASVASGMDTASALKFASFPFFLAAVWIAARAARAVPGMRPWTVFAVEGALLTGVGAASALAGSPSGLTALNIALGLVVVFAMGLQNQAQAGLDAPPTTVMTGNITRVVAMLATAGQAETQRTTLLVEIGGFTAGCIVGAVSVLVVGLINFLGLGLVMLAIVWREGLSGSRRARWRSRPTGSEHPR